jgi:hypothetical protein
MTENRNIAGYTPDANGARRSRRFKPGIRIGPGISRAAPQTALKRAKARAPATK